MNSKSLLILVGLALIVSSCTTEVDFEAEVIADTDWTPDIYLENNDYQRIRLNIEKPPRKELLRNIDSYIIEVKQKGSIFFAPLDTIPGAWIPPLYIYPSYRYVTIQSDPGLRYNTEYVGRVSVKYISGSTKYSYETHFTTPPERGKVLRRISLSTQGFYYAPSIAFHKKDFLAFGGDKLFRVDTTTGQQVLITDNFRRPPDAREIFSPFNIAVVGDTLIAIYDQGYQLYTIVRLDLQTLAVDSSLRISGEGKSLLSFTGHGSNLLLLWYTPSDQQQITIVDPRNGQTIHTFPPVTRRFEYPCTLASDGINIWYSAVSSFANRIYRFDPSNFSFLEDHRNPVFNPQSLTWDGANFWVIDQETRTLAKLKLEGF